MARFPCQSPPGGRPRRPRRSARRLWWYPRRCRRRSGRCSSEIRPVAKTNVDELGGGAGARELVTHCAQRCDLLFDIAHVVEACAPAVARRHFESDLAAPFETKWLHADRRPK